MTTPRDLCIVSLDVESSRPVEQGDLSLALAGAEAIDLLTVHAMTLDGDRIVPNDQWATGDHLLDEAASSLVRRAPYESVGDWLWRRGRNLSAEYMADLEAEGEIERQRDRRWIFFGPSHMVLAESLARHLAESRWASGEPVLAALAAAVGIGDEGISGAGAGDSPKAVEDAETTVLTAVDDALEELRTERRRRIHRREEAAEDNRRRDY
jgi:hypothetical protein